MVPALATPSGNEEAHPQVLSHGDVQNELEEGTGDHEMGEESEKEEFFNFFFSHAVRAMTAQTVLQLRILLRILL